MKYAQLLLLVALFFTSVSVAQRSNSTRDSVREESMAALINEALSRNPDIAVERDRVEAARQKIPQESALPDPELIFKMMEIPGLDFGNATFANLELMQMVPFPTKLSTKRSLAELLLTHASYGQKERIAMTTAEVKMAAATLWYAREVLALNQANQDILRRVLKAVETAYAVGNASQQDVLKSNIELAKTISEETVLRSRTLGAENKLRELLNRPSSIGIGRVSPSTGRVTLPPVEKLLSASTLRRPILAGDSLSIVEKELALSLMKQEYLPDLKFSLEYVRMPMAMENRWSFSAGITLPFSPWTLGKASARVQEGEADKRMSESMYVSRRNSVAAAIRTRYEEANGRARQLDIYERSVLPQLRQSIAVMLTEYETGKTSFLMLLDSYRMYNEGIIGFAMARMQYSEAVAELEREVGVTDISSLSSTGKEDSQ
jgi:outer membrane protein TolC